MKNRYNTQTVQLILEWMACGLLLLVITIIAGGCNWDTHDDPVMALLLFRYGSQSTPFQIIYIYLSLIFYIISGQDIIGGCLFPFWKLFLHGASIFISSSDPLNPELKNIHY